ncbi:MAG TPA: glyoxalase, partial [Geobacter sp.]|nr:glyoxalase [Geobacter sp.]
GIGFANRIGLRHLAFAVSDIEAEVKRLRGHGIEFIGEVETWEKTGKKLIYFYGPDGIILEFAQYPE